MTPDPIGLEGGDVNLFSYVWQDPINWIDPMGLSAVLPYPGGISSGLGAGAAGSGGSGGLSSGQWQDMKDDLSLLDPRPLINTIGNWFANESDEEECEVPTTPPDGLVENPHRPGSWGEIGPDGKFKEKWRRDKGRPEIKSGHGSRDHIHLDGKKKYYDIP